MTVLLNKNDILEGLRAIDEKAKDSGVIIDLAVYGGAALALVFGLRDITRDVDAVVRGNPDFLRKAAAQIAQDKGWPEDWLNDGVKGFLSNKETMETFPEFDLQTDSKGGLRIYTPTAEYLFAMKCMAMRAQDLDGSKDIEDIKNLAKEIGISTSEQAIQIVQKYYRNSLIPAKVSFGIEEIMETMQKQTPKKKHNLKSSKKYPSL